MESDKYNSLKKTYYQKNLEDLQDQILQNKQSKVERVLNDKLAQIESAKQDLLNMQSYEGKEEKIYIQTNGSRSGRSGMGCNIFLSFLNLLPKPGCCSIIFLTVLVFVLGLFGIVYNEGFRNAVVGNLLYKYIDDGYRPIDNVANIPLNSDVYFQNRLAELAISENNIESLEITDAEINTLLRNVDVKVFGDSTIKFVKISDNLMELYMRRNQVENDVWTVFDIQIVNSKPVVTKFKYGKINLDISNIRNFQGAIPILNTINIEKLDEEFSKIILPTGVQYDIDNIVLGNSKLELSLIRRK